MKKLLVLLMCVSSLATAKDVCDTSTQGGINMCSMQSAQSADKELNQVYKAVLNKFSKEKEFTDNLKKAQRAWLVWRDAEVSAIYPGDSSQYGQVYAMCHEQAVEELTRQRIKQLKKWLNGTEGDACLGSFPSKD